MKTEEVLGLLEDVNVLCRDNGEKFDKNNCERVEVLKKKLLNSSYNCTEGDLFLLFHKKPFSDYTGKILLISSHIDCKQPDHGYGEEGITSCFSTRISETMIKGTYDNSITNAAILFLMLKEQLPDDVIVAFTGDEEEDSGGAIQVVKLLKRYDLEYKCIVLDVTDAGWEEGVDFTIENNFWNDKMGKKVISKVAEYSDNWLFVPEEMYNVPDYVSRDKVYHMSSEPDESWEYDEKNIKCFSLCIPVHGEMHSDEGVVARINNLENYIQVLKILTNI